MDINSDILKRYFAGTCTPAERLLVIEYLSRGDNELPVFTSLLDQETQSVTPQEIPPVMHKSLVYAIRKNAYPDFLKLVQPGARLWRYAAGMAAILLPLLVFIGIRSAQNKSATTFHEIAILDQWDTVANNTSSAQKVILSDGSSVWLMAKSSLSYMPQQYAQANRTVRLSGEAFFDVQSNPGQPFIVYHGAICTRVLGTAFNIEAYGDESDIRISLVRGKVAINKSTDTTMQEPLHILDAGGQLTYQKNDGRIAVRPLTYTNEMVYTKGWMVLDAVPLTDAIKRIGRYYGLKILVPQEIADGGRKITAIFKGGSPDEILHNMLFPYRLQHVRRGNIIYIQKDK